MRGFGLGAMATYKCNNGFILSDGFTVRVCLENEQWAGKAGVCQRTYILAHWISNSLIRDMAT